MPESFLPKYELLGGYFGIFLLLIFYVLIGYVLYSIIGFGIPFIVTILGLAFLFFLAYKKFSEHKRKIRESHNNHQEYSLRYLED